MERWTGSHQVGSMNPATDNYSCTDLWTKALKCTSRKKDRKTTEHNKTTEHDTVPHKMERKQTGDRTRHTNAQQTSSTGRIPSRRQPNNSRTKISANNWNRTHEPHLWSTPPNNLREEPEDFYVYHVFCL